jgi:hypothetical protein
MEFNFDLWFHDTFGRFEHDLKIPGYMYSYQEYKSILKSLGWTLHYNDHGDVTHIRFNENGLKVTDVDNKYIIKKFIPPPPPQRHCEPWTIEEKSELLSSFSKWLNQNTKKHQRSEKSIKMMIDKLVQ